MAVNKFSNEVKTVDYKGSTILSVASNGVLKDLNEKHSPLWFRVSLSGQLCL